LIGSGKALTPAARPNWKPWHFIQQWVDHRISPMCGNSVWHDRRFLARFMPELESYFHYRNIDVSTLKELALRWAPDLPKFAKECHHLAHG
jgi:oligoribonuclease